MQNRIIDCFEQQQGDLLNIFCTAGYPGKEDTAQVIEYLAEAGADLVEIGIPFSDPIADGNTIQASNQQSLNQGMTLELLMEQLKGIREKVQIPLLMMGYLNPVMQYGLERFCEDAATAGIDGIILPDLPMGEFEREYKALFEQHNLLHIFLITPQTSEARIRKIDELSKGFIYMVSTDSTTGKTSRFNDTQVAYFERIKAMKLQNPCMIGFGIADHESYRLANDYAQGAIVGSAFIKAISKGGELKQAVHDFVKEIKSPVIQ